MKLKLLDTGYVSNVTPVESQTQLAASERAGTFNTTSVKSFELDVQSVSITNRTNTEAKPEIGTFTDSETTLISTTNRVLAVNIIIQKRIDSTGWETNDIVQFFRLERTKGLKLFYPTVTTDQDKTIVEALGAENVGGTFGKTTFSDALGVISSSDPYLVGRVKNITLADNPTGDYWRLSFNFEVTS